MVYSEVLLRIIKAEFNFDIEKKLEVSEITGYRQDLKVKLIFKERYGHTSYCI